MRRFDLTLHKQGLPLARAAWQDIAVTRPQLCIFRNMAHLRSPLSLLTAVVLSPSLSSLTIVVDPRNLTETSESMERASDTIVSISPSITSLHISGSDRDSSLPNSSGRLISRLTGLTKVILPASVLNTFVLWILSRLEHLRDIIIDAETPDQLQFSDIIRLREQENDDIPFLLESFRVLHTFSLRCLSTRTATRLLTHHHFPAYRLRSLWIKLVYEGTENDIDLKDLLACLVDGCPLLQVLTVRCSCARIEDDLSSSNKLSSLTFDDIFLFTKISLLTSFTLGHPYAVALTSEDICRLARSCERFTHIWLNPCPRSSRFPGLSLDALLPFALYCPRLLRLGLYFDTTQHFDSVSAMVYFDSLQELFLGFSTIDDDGFYPRFDLCSQISLLLFYLLPRECFLRTIDDYTDRGADLFSRSALSGIPVRSWDIQSNWKIVRIMIALMHEESDVLETEVLELQNTLDSMEDMRFRRLST